MNAPIQHRRMLRELTVDSFAGGGGASEGIKIALGRDPDIAVNHDPAALAMHRINHPGTRHFVQDVAVVDSVGLCDGLPLGMLWMSPDCTDHSKAKGSAPIRDGDRTTRGIGWAIVGWVKALPMWQRPRVIFLENVEEYEQWGPLMPNGKRDPAHKGEIFKQFVAAWRALGYKNIEWRQRRAWLDGAGTIRNRLYMVMRRDGEPIVWPEATYGNPNDDADAALIKIGKLKPWVTAADCLDFSLPCPSIFDTSAEIKAQYNVRAKRPLAINTDARIAKGVKRWVLEAANPYVTKFRSNSVGHDLTQPLHTVTAHSSKTHGGGAAPLGLVTPSIATFMAQHNNDSRRIGGVNPGRPAAEPLATITQTGSQQGVIAASMMTLRGSDRRDSSANEPKRTTSAQGNHDALINMPLMTVYYGTDDDGASVGEPSRTETAKPRFGLAEVIASAPPFSAEHHAKARKVAEFLREHGCWDGGEFVTMEVEGVTVVLVDIGLRMLTPRERFNAQGFRPDYVIDHGLDENSGIIPFTLEQQGYMCGNSVCPPVAAALVRANYRPREVMAPAGWDDDALPLFMEAME